MLNFRKRFIAGIIWQTLAYLPDYQDLVFFYLGGGRDLFTGPLMERGKAKKVAWITDQFYALIRKIVVYLPDEIRQIVSCLSD